MFETMVSAGKKSFFHGKIRVAGVCSTAKPGFVAGSRFFRSHVLQNRVTHKELTCFQVPEGLGMPYKPYKPLKQVQGLGLRTEVQGAYHG